MHLVLRKGAFLAVFGVVTLACNTPDVELESDLGVSKTTDTVEFKGERVVIPGNFPKELFDQTQEEFDVYYGAIS